MYSAICLVVPREAAPVNLPPQTGQRVGPNIQWFNVTGRQPRGRSPPCRVFCDRRVVDCILTRQLRVGNRIILEEISDCRVLQSRTQFLDCCAKKKAALETYNRQQFSGALTELLTSYPQPSRANFPPRLRLGPLPAGSPSLTSDLRTVCFSNWHLDRPLDSKSPNKAHTQFPARIERRNRPSSIR